ncbi:RsfA family transcriptional regulator [Lentibacillus sp. Marseille-P4043]|uniref:RsfA family transcriptional regulator n=1 Tax=Lentibacillus sp. Marseille-P4043 TaxID=2040293 RepID=UPI000D0BD4D9|nr:RsfA family transcriptional regulator [Lentibacillus sp. Marseille-P4043]
MEATRQDAWTKDEDVILAETVIRYIREGQTQLEAFKDVAKQLSRTSAACGFRWNATIRKHYQDAIHNAKEERKQAGRKTTSWSYVEPSDYVDKDPIATAISLLEKMKINYSAENQLTQKEQEKIIKHLEQENEKLKAQLQRYEGAWQEMGKLWDWVTDQTKE